MPGVELQMPATKLLLQEEDRKRHLLRMWLAPQDGWELPEQFAERYHTVTKGELHLQELLACKIAQLDGAVVTCR